MKPLFAVALLFALLSGFVRADPLKLEGDAASVERDGNLRRARALYLKAAKEREAQFAKITKARPKSAILDLDDDRDEQLIFGSMADRLALQELAIRVELQFRAGYDYLHAAQTNAAERLLARAETEAKELLRQSETAKAKRQVQAAETWLREIRLARHGVGPATVPPGADVRTLLAESRIRKEKGDFQGALKLAEAAMEKRVDVETVHAALAARSGLPGQDETIAWIKRMADNRCLSDRDRLALWKLAGTYVGKRFRMDDLKEAIAATKRLGGTPEKVWLQTLESYADYARFPYAETEIVFPQGLGDFGVTVKGKTVRAEDYLELDASPSADMTKAVQEAIDTKGVQTVVIGKLKHPWRITQVKLRSNLRIQLEKGAVVLGEDLSRRVKGMDKDMFVVNEARNVVIEGLGTKPADCFIGKYATHAERRANGRRYYGGSGIALCASSRVLIRNLKVSYNTCDGCVIRGSYDCCRDVWIDNVVFDGNYRQGLSVIDGDGVYVRNSFFTGTDGGEPTAGVDLEPGYHSQHIANVYFSDCVFAGNLGGGLVVAAASVLPVSVCVRRCRFGADPIGAVRTTARTTVYTAAEHPAVGHLLFEDCRFEGAGKGKGRPVCFFGCPLFDMTILNSTPKATDRSFCVTNTSWNPGWADWKKYPYRPKLDFSGRKGRGDK